MNSVLDIFEYEKINDEEYRYLLGKKGNNPLYCIGMNPSTAKTKKFDQTVLKIFGLALIHGYDSCVMMNLLPIMETDSSIVSSENKKMFLDKNIKQIINIIDNDILACWGDNIGRNSDMKESFIKIYNGVKEQDINWLCIDNEKEDSLMTQGGNPRHPSRINYFRELKCFNIHEYFQKIEN